MIEREAWYREADERDLARLQKEWERNPDAGIPEEYYQSMRRLGKLHELALEHPHAYLMLKDRYLNDPEWQEHVLHALVLLHGDQSFAWAQALSPEERQVLLPEVRGVFEVRRWRYEDDQAPWSVEHLMLDGETSTRPMRPKKTVDLVTLVESMRRLGFDNPWDAEDDEAEWYAFVNTSLDVENVTLRGHHFDYDDVSELVDRWVTRR